MSVPGASADKRNREEVPGLTGLRFVAAFSVLLAHSFAVLMRGHLADMPQLNWFTQAAGFGMTLFFVLSGFVIHYNYARVVTRGTGGIVAFLWARFARLYPLLVLILAISAVLSVRGMVVLGQWRVLDDHRDAFYGVLQALPAFLLSIQSWFYLPIDNNALIYAIRGGSAPLTWSISTEWFFYLAYLFIAWAILRARTASSAAALIVLWCALWIGVSLSLFHYSAQMDAWAEHYYGSIAGVKEHFQDSFVRWLLYFSPYSRLGEFVLGALAAQLYVGLQPRKVTRRENLVGSLLFYCAAASVLLVTFAEYSPDVGMNIFRKMSLNFALAPSAALLIFCAARYLNPGSRLLNSRPAILLGNASYSIYLVHFGILMFVAGRTGTHGLVLDLLKVVVVGAAILLISVLVYMYYEDPARKFLRRLVSSKKP